MSREKIVARGWSLNNGIGIRFKKTGVLLFLFLAFAAFAFWAPGANAKSEYFSPNCATASCHASPIPSTCNGCHAHGVHASSSKTGINLAAATNKSTYAPGETVSVTITGGYRTGWVRAILYNQSGVEVNRSTGTATGGMGGGAAFPITLTGAAPAAAGTYTFTASWYGNKYDLAESGGTTSFGPNWTPDPNNPNHGQEKVSTNSFTVSAAVTLSSIAISGASSVNEGATSTYTATATWSDGTNTTVTPTWSTNLGTISAAGVLSAPAVTANQTATIGASYTSGGVTKTNSVSVSIVNVAATLTITTGSLPSGTVNTAYNRTLAATGGTTPYSWSLSAGTLPAGLTLSSAGVIGGTPTAAATSTFTVRVTDGAAATATKQFSVTINPAAEVAGGTTVMPTEGAVDVPVNTVVTGTLTGTGDIASTFNAQTFTLKAKGSELPDSKCVKDGFVKGAISYNASNTAGTFTPACPLTNGTVYAATIASSPGGLSVSKKWEFTTIAASPDTDGDGVPDNEDDHPGNSGKGTPPSSRGRGRFLVDVTDTAGASLAFAEGIAETDASLNQTGIPSEYEFPDGLVSYQVIGVVPGGTATVKVTFPSGIPAGSKVYKVGTAGFQEFAGATIQGNTVTLTLTDGGAGDRDGLVNGIIVDPVGVAVPVASGAGSIDLSSASGGGGCSVAVRTGSGGSYIDGTLILAGLGMAAWGIRIRRRRG